MPNQPFHPGDDWQADNEAYGHAEPSATEAADEKVRMAVNVALVEAGIDTRAVSIVAKGGSVTISGTVPPRQKSLVAGAAKKAKGATSVTDNTTAK